MDTIYSSRNFDASEPEFIIASNFASFGKVAPKLRTHISGSITVIFSTGESPQMNLHFLNKMVHGI